MTRTAEADCGAAFGHDPHIWRTQRGKVKACDGAVNKRCPACRHGSHAQGLCEADQRPACNCLTDEVGE